MARAVRMEALRKFTAGMNGATAGLFRDYILFRTFEADPNLPGPRLEIASRAKSALETYKKRMEASKIRRRFIGNGHAGGNVSCAAVERCGAGAGVQGARRATQARNAGRSGACALDETLSAPATKEQMKISMNPFPPL
jgi:hypothetical protein